jgi:hypothetical protein
MAKSDLWSKRLILFQTCLALSHQCLALIQDSSLLLAPDLLSLASSLHFPLVVNHLSQEIVSHHLKI